MLFNAMREERVDSITAKLNSLDPEDLYSIADIQTLFSGLFLENEGCSDTELSVYVKATIEDIDRAWYIRKHDNIIHELVFKFVHAALRVAALSMVPKSKQAEFEEVHKKISDGFGSVLLI